MFGRKRKLCIFLNSRQYNYHVDFCSRYLHKSIIPIDHEKFNAKNYLTTKRSYVLLSIVRYIDQGIFAIELWPGDNLSGERIKEIFDMIAEKVYFSNKLRYRISSPLQLEIIEQTEIIPPIIDSDQLFAGVVYQPLTRGKAFGTLKLFLGENSSEYDLDSIELNDIIILHSIPLELPACAGVITICLQTPLCHVSLLCKNRRTPNSTIRDIVSHERILSLEGKIVRYVVGDSYSLTEARESDFKRWKKSRKSLKESRSIKDLKRDLSDIGVIKLLDVEKKNRKCIGSKAEGLWVVYKILNQFNHIIDQFVNISAFVIPFKEFDDVISVYWEENDTVNHETLQVLVALIENADISILVDEVFDMIESVKEDAQINHASGFIFRSSTNVEDLKGFNGAGLYLSEITTLEPSKAEIEIVIKDVWKSVYSKRGFVERDIFRINEKLVSMGIMVQPLITNVICNGVAVTSNILGDSEYEAFFVNCQVGGSKVTDGNSIPEQVLIYDDESGPVPEILSKSSLNNGNPILNTSDYIRIFEILMPLHEMYNTNSSHAKQSRAADVEFLVLNNADRNIVVLQCRPLSL
eukprot:TRINITY_DN1866_c0_g1_i2.p1 TRINITY_DN1866_c0_g1~~TRINITY_DN1866_c0_g1_i2.p1  ORF type:complete len:579 (+),score=89.64 TRINITY_DN1866_c0_g1_i2:138-1874(+)